MLEILLSMIFFYRSNSFGDIDIPLIFSDEIVIVHEDCTNLPNHVNSYGGVHSTLLFFYLRKTLGV